MPRASWNGFLRLSLVSCPVALVPATTEAKRVRFNQLNSETGNRVQQQLIDSQTGEVVGWIDLTGLLSSVYHVDAEAVLNGIAYDPVKKRLFVTGKLWPSVFEIKLLPKVHR